MALNLSRRRLLLGLAAAPFAVSIATNPAIAAILDTPLDLTFKGGIRLNSNENALGMSPNAKAAIANAMAETNRYPDMPYRMLIDETATYLGVGDANLLFTNGSAEILNNTTAMIGREGGKIIAPALTFEAVAGSAQILGVPYETVAMGPDYLIDLAAMEKAALSASGPVLVYLVTPNNPTGTLSSSAAIKGWIKRAPDNVFFLVDEAYHDFVDAPDYESMISLVKAGYKNLIVARTFSKIYALAGLRVGYGVAHPDAITRIGDLNPYGNLNILGIAAAIASLKDTEWAAHSKAQNARAKAITLEALNTLGLEALPSQANFIFHKINAPLKDYREHMESAGFLVGRPFGGLDNWNRLSLATPAIMERFADTLLRFRSKGWV